MSDLNEAISAAATAEPSGDPYALARPIVARFTKADLLPLVAEAIVNRQRLATLKVERAVSRQFLPGSESTERRAAVLQRFRPLEKSSVTIVVGQPRVAWDLATREQWYLRKEMLTKKRDGLNQTIQQCDDVLDVLDKFGVNCLAELRDEGEVAA